MKTEKVDPRACKKIDFSGVPGELISLEEAADVEFAAKWLRKSPYDPLLRKLEEMSDFAGGGKVLRFADVKARASIANRAKKLGYKVLFGDLDGKLYVKFNGYDLTDRKPKEVPAKPAVSKRA